KNSGLTDEEKTIYHSLLTTRGNRNARYTSFHPFAFNILLSFFNIPQFYYAWSCMIFTIISYYEMFGRPAFPESDITCEARFIIAIHELNGLRKYIFIFVIFNVVQGRSAV